MAEIKCPPGVWTDLGAGPFTLSMARGAAEHPGVFIADTEDGITPPTSKTRVIAMRSLGNPSNTDATRYCASANHVWAKPFGNSTATVDVSQ